MEGREKTGAVETLLVIILLVILSVAVFSLAASGGKAYRKILENRNSFSSARVALLYLDVKIRQNDNLHSVHISGDVIPETDTLIIEHPDEMMTYIFFNDGALWESYIHNSVEPSKDLAMKVCGVSGLEMQENGKMIRLSAGYVYNDSEKYISSVIYLRTYIDEEKNEKPEE